jgi:hypothetical protein
MGEMKKFKVQSLKFKVEGARLSLPALNFELWTLNLELSTSWPTKKREARRGVTLTSGS